MRSLGSLSVIFDPNRKNERFHRRHSIRVTPLIYFGNSSMISFSHSFICFSSHLFFAAKKNLFFLNSVAPIYEKNSHQYNIDWRYNEFPNPAFQLIYCLPIEVFYHTGQENFNAWKLFAEPFLTAYVDHQFNAVIDLIDGKLLFLKILLEIQLFLEHNS